MANIESYRDLRVWQLGMEIAQRTYELTAAFPREEIYGLTAQVRRASVSVPSNIAEGYGRENAGSYTHHLRIAQGSLKELETQIILAQRLRFLSPDAAAELLVSTEDLGKMLRSQIRRVQTSD